ncbi:MAG: PaaI family thioesterase [Actinomycetota bacterium]
MDESLLDTNNDLQTGELGRKLGIAYEEVSGSRVVATMPVAGNRQPYGFLHGGAICSLVEELASFGAAIAAASDEKIVMGLHQSTNFLGTSTEGTVRGTATAIHQGNTTQLWQVDVTHLDSGKLIASGRVTIAVRTPRT